MGDQESNVKVLERVFNDASAKPIKISYGTLRIITQNFTQTIGSGGFGIVFMGKLPNGGMVAVKKLSSRTQDFSNKEFEQEVNVLTKLNHKNIVRYLGYCADTHGEMMDINGNLKVVEEPQRVLCFEYVPNGNLHHYIKEKSYGFEWNMRYQIIKGICEGLHYLRQEGIYHLDLKPDNVLLGDQMVPKITDFGLSRRFAGQKSTIVTVNVMGTMGYMAPELIDNQQISFKTDIYSLGVILINLLSESNEYSRNWHKSLDKKCPQMKRCAEIASCCIEKDPKNRPTIDDILLQLNETETMFQIVDRVIYEPSKDENSPLYQILERFHKLSAESDLTDSSRTDRPSRGSIVASAVYRPPLPWDIFSCPTRPSSDKDEINLTDGVSYNHNCRPIPAAALKALIAKKPELASECGATADDVDNGRATGLMFVSERDAGLETLHVALRCNDMVKVLSLADIYGADDFAGVRMEDVGGFGTSFVGHYADPSVIYISTKRKPGTRRTAWTAVYRTNLTTGETKQLTPDGKSDLSPAVSPSGTRVAVAAFESGWTGEVEHLKTDIVVMNVDRYASGGGLDRKIIINDGGWPSWGSDNVIFFHRGVEELEDPASCRTTTCWGVFRYDLTAMQIDRVTPTEMDAMTPAAISETKVAVATIRSRAKQITGRREAQYRHIEIFDVSMPNQPPVKITQNVCPKADYYSPFVLDGGDRIGYHRLRREMLMQKENGISEDNDVPRVLQNVQASHNDVKLLGASGISHSFSHDGSALAFVDHKMKSVWLADSHHGLRKLHERRGDNLLLVEWNKNPDIDTLYLCVGASFRANSPVEIYALTNVSLSIRPQLTRLTKGRFNNAFPSTNPEGTKFVFQSTRDQQVMDEHACYKNLYIMEDAQTGEFLGDDMVTRLTNGPWIDTQCQWSPRGNWIVFSSTRDKPTGAGAGAGAMPDNGLDLGHFAIYLVNPSNPTAVVRVVTSGDPGPGAGSVAGHVNHPVFSPDGTSIAFSSDIAGVSTELISMPMFLHPVRPYGDIFSVDIDTNDIYRNVDIDRIHRVTHSRYQYSPEAWTKFAMVHGGSQRLLEQAGNVDAKFIAAWVEFAMEDRYYYISSFW